MGSLTKITDKQVTFKQSGTGAVVRNMGNKVRESVSVLDFIPSGTNTTTTDCTSWIQDAFDYVATFSDGGEVSFPIASRYRCDSGLVLDTNKVKLNGCGSVLDFSNATSGDMISVVNSNATVSLRAVLNTAHPISDLTLWGPGVAVTAVSAVLLNDASGLNTLCGVRFNNCVFLNFAKDVFFGVGAFCNTFNQCQFTTTTGTPSTYSIQIPISVNSGERNEFISCMWFNRQNILDQTNVSADTFLVNCSLDYFGDKAMLVTGGHVTLSNCHIESDGDVSTWFDVGGAWPYSTLSITGGTITFSTAKVNFSPFYCDATITNGGVMLNAVTVIQGNTWETLLVSGTGVAIANNLNFVNKSVAISESQNVLAYGSFEEANWASDWVLSGAVLPTQSALYAHTGTKDLLFAATSGASNSKALRTAPTRPGQFSNVTWWQLGGVQGSGGTFYARISYLDAGGNELRGNEVVKTTADVNAGSWVKYSLQFAEIAPKGTTHTRLVFEVFGVTSGTPEVRIDDVVWTVS